MLKKLVIIFLLGLSLENTQGQSQSTPNALSNNPFTIGEITTIHSQVLNEDRTLNIYLPPSYHPDSLRKFPVIYLLDGSADEDFIHTVGLVQYGNFPWINLLPESIVVGIANVDRRRDFTFPTTIQEDKTRNPTSGSSTNFIQFLEKELLPFMGQNYLVNDTTTLIGQSLGGLIATEILFKKPDMFHNYVIISPSLWWDKESLLAQMPSFKSANKSIYVGVGKKEPVPMERDAKNLYQKIKSQKVQGFYIYYNLFKEQGHADIMHLALYDAFTKIFMKK
ncbi:MAG: alpha/beta hydrolase [Bacteroidetes bacterium]|nr:alpha/beta hydrolase [Bacteroidota bacterium]